MKTIFKSLLGLSLILASCGYAQAKTASDDLDSLGGNSQINERARAMDPHNHLSIVQNRQVDRNLRLEVGAAYGPTAGGSDYVSTQNLGATMDFHITPRWSVGGRYFHSINSLTSEGKAVYDQASSSQNASYQIPDVDAPTDTYLGTISWYPLYGKINIFDMTTAQFDIYTIAGAGVVKLVSSGESPVYTAGGGVGFWLAQHFCTRFEVRYQTYQDHVYSGNRQENMVVGTASLGFLL
jgi:outer membrane immunogenic protein